MIENARLRKAALFCLFLLAGGVLSACMKFELQYDFLQYHYYNGFAFWNNRLGVDIAPAFIPTFYNPLLDAVMYALMSVLKQHVTIYCFIQGLWFGALMYFAFKISALYFDLTTRSGKVFAGLSLLICATGTATWFQMGTATHETELAVLTVGAFYLLLRDNKRFFAAGLLLGMAAGFKLTAAIYCISTGLTLILFYKTLDKPLKSISVFALGGLIGFLIVDGFWMIKLWNLYDNPFFPFWNGIFKPRTQLYRPAAFERKNVLGQIVRAVFNGVSEWFFREYGVVRSAICGGGCRRCAFRCCVSEAYQQKSAVCRNIRACLLYCVGNSFF